MLFLNDKRSSSVISRIFIRKKSSASRHYTSLPACPKTTFAPMKNRTDPKNDRVFKHIFHNHPRALMHLLNSFLPLIHPIVDLEYMPEELHDDLGEGRLGIVDVRCRDSLGRTCIVEMQIRKIPMMMQRMLWNAARLLSRQPSKGGSFRGLQPVYTLCLLDQPLAMNEEDWIHHYQVQSDTSSIPVIEGLHFTIVEIQKWLKLGKFDKGDARHAWMLFFTQPDAMKQVYTPEERAKLEEMFEAVDAWDLTRHTENELWVMDKKIDIMLTTELVAEVSFEEGREAGIEVGKHKILEALLALKSEADFSDEALKEKFGLSTEEILLLRTMV